MRLIDGVGNARELTAGRSGQGLGMYVPVGALPVATARGRGRKWEVDVGYVVMEM